MSRKIQFEKKSGRKKVKKPKILEKKNSRQLRGRRFPIPTKKIFKNMIKYKQQILKKIKIKKWNKDRGTRIMDHGSRTLDLGPGMNDHPGRDTNVRSRPSESILKDLSFDIGFTRIQSSNKHAGPCFGMNGHFRRDPDTISRLPDTTIKDLSFFIGFIKIQSSIKYLGPCFGTNGHFCRDPDMISRLPGTTTQALSVFIGFRCSSTFKIGV